jgi:hypothetical protein
MHRGKPVNSTAAVQPPIEILAELRKNQRRAHLTRNLRRGCGYGSRAADEPAIELATRVDALAVLDELAQRFADRLDPDLLRAIGCRYVPCPPLRIFGRR